MTEQNRDTTVHQQVQEKYAQAATQAADCQPSCCGDSIATQVFGASLYSQDDLSQLPQKAAYASLGCGNPTALATLQLGETVLDLGSGGGIDVLLSAKRVGAMGKVYGLDMTDEMLALARENQRQAGVENVEFLKGQIEAIPLLNNSVDVIISNCVVNLSPNKDAVLSEAYRVLRNGGRLAISDIVIRDAEPGEPDIPETVKQNLERWTGCIAGALQAQEYRNKLSAAGFVGIEIEEVRRYTLADLGIVNATANNTGEPLIEAIASRFTSAFVRAVKPSIRDDRQTQDEGIIVPATATDLPGVQALLQAADLPIAGLAHHLEHLYILKINDRILGAIGFETYRPYALIRSLVVAPEIRGQGFGCRLLKFILEALQSQDFREVYALTLTIADWLKRSGFEEILRQDIPSTLTASQLLSTCCCSSAQVYRLQL